MPETYTFELSFTGLCVFTFTGQDKRKPDRVDALLVNTLHHSGSHRHVPLLGFEGRNVELASSPGFRLAPGPDGRLLCVKDLEGAWPLEIEVRNFGLPDLEAVWRPGPQPLDKHPYLSDRSEEEWLDWVMALKRMNPETDFPQQDPPYNGLKHEVTDHHGTRPSMCAWVRLTGGVLKARGFPMEWSTTDGRWAYDLWDFKEPTSGGNKSATHAMAASVVLSIPRIPVASMVVLKDGRGFEVWLAPRREPDARYQALVQASVTNLPQEDDGSGIPPAYLEHFQHYYDAVHFSPAPPNEIRLPHPVSHTITLVGSFCPPVTHTEGS